MTATEDKQGREDKVNFFEHQELLLKKDKKEIDHCREMEIKVYRE